MTRSGARRIPDMKALALATAHLRRADPVMAALIAGLGPCGFTTERRGSAFSKLVQSILYQQLAGHAAATIHGRLRRLVGRRHPRPADILAASDQALRGCGLSRQKITYLRDLAGRASDGLALRGLGRLEDEVVIERLVQVKGVGRWTAEMFLMFRLGRLDVLPVDDYGVRSALRSAYRLRELPRPDWMRRKAEAWRPYRSVACWYLWRLIDSGAKAD
jgi:3-methyladenine DNA glycosylase/8-oxoguanine DNA glycosylase